MPSRKIVPPCRSASSSSLRSKSGVKRLMRIWMVAVMGPDAVLIWTMALKFSGAAALPEVSTPVAADNTAMPITSREETDTGASLIFRRIQSDLTRRRCRCLLGQPCARRRAGAEVTASTAARQRTGDRCVLCAMTNVTSSSNAPPLHRANSLNAVSANRSADPWGISESQRAARSVSKNSPVRSQASTTPSE